MTQHTDNTKYDLVNTAEQAKHPILDAETRKNAFFDLENLEFPTKKIETWKHADLRPMLKHRFSVPDNFVIDKNYIENLTIHGLNSQKIVFANGKFMPEFSEISDTEIMAMPLALAKQKRLELVDNYLGKAEYPEKTLFSELNTAFAEDGFFVYLPKGTAAARPIHIMNFLHGDNQKIMVQSRNLILVGVNSEVKIINSYHSLSTDYTLNNVVTEIRCEPDSHVDYYLFQGEGNDAFHIHDTRVTQLRGSKFTANTTTLCGAIVRNNLYVNLQGEHCETDLSGLHMPEKEQYSDNYVFVNHAKPRCSSKQLYRGIIDNKAEAVFLGKIFVAKDSQKTDSQQSNKNILLTPYAKAHSKPQLEIYADDVACAHGSTTGQLDKESMFYLRSRGISERRARTLMLGAFASSTMDNIKLQPYKDFVNFLINKRLHGEEVTGLCDIKICPSC